MGHLLRDGGKQYSVRLKIKELFDSDLLKYVYKCKERENCFKSNINVFTVIINLK